MEESSNITFAISFIVLLIIVLLACC